MAFKKSPPSSKHHAAHKDRDVRNNGPKNLYWATPQQNIADRERHGTTCRAENKPNAKLKNADIHEIRRQLKNGINQHVIAAQFGVSNYCISDINRGKSWKSV